MKALNFKDYIINFILISIYILLFCNAVYSQQLTKFTHPNLISERDLYFDNQGNKYSDLITFKFNQKIIDLPQNQKTAQINNIANQSLRNFFNSLQNKYGSIVIEKVFPSAIWGDTIKLNWRTKQLVTVKDLSQVFRITFNKIVPIDSIMTALKQFPEVEYAHEPLQAFTTIEPNDSLYVYGNKWHHIKINAPFAWDITKGNPNLILSINDSYGGANFPHPDLAPKIVRGFGAYGGHGQAVAGVAAAVTNNFIGVASLGWELKIMQSIWVEQDEIKKAADSGCSVINFSWRVLGNYNDIRDAIHYAISRGVICVAAAGNSEWGVPSIAYPAAYNFGTTGQVIAVSGTRLYNGIEKFVDGWNYSPCDDPISQPECAFIDIAAPGCDIPILAYNSIGYGMGCGTSVAAPQVAALAGLILSIDSTLTPVQVYDIITKTADKIGQYPYNSIGWNKYLGYGRINAYNALNVARGAPNRPFNFSVNKTANNHPLLRWNRNQENYSVHYRIYKKVTEESGYQLIATTTDTFYIDQSEFIVTQPSPKERWISYKVSAAYYRDSETMLQSVHTDPISVKVSGPPLEKQSSQKVIYEYELYQNYPNPFNPTTKIRYSLKENSLVNLRVYDLLGREIAVLVNEPQEAGLYEVEFDASKYNLSSGIYFYQLRAGEYNSIRKFTLIK
ncbi:MAG: S8 family serine peptidase [Ignavibacteria bacterium]